MDSDIVQPASPDASEPSKLCVLPAELRNQIYRLALVEDKPFEIHGVKILRKAQWYGRTHYGVRLLRVNRMIHDEASAIFYGQNEHEIKGPWYDNLDAELDAMGRNAALLRNTRILSPATSRFPRGPEMPCSLGALSTLQNRCFNMRKLVIIHWNDPLPPYSSGGLRHERSTWVVDYILPLCDERTRGFVNLEKVVFEASRDVADNDIRGAISDFGWTLKLIGHL